MNNNNLTYSKINIFSDLSATTYNKLIIIIII